MRNLPRGRAARLWLRDRLAVAERGTDVLEQKLHALTREQRRLAQHHRQTRTAWQQAMAEADRWFRRAVVLGGSQQFQLARAELTHPAEARVGWRTTMGATYPARVDLQLPDTAGVAAIGRSSALASAAGAYQQAVTAALDHAAAARALDLVEVELAITRRRLRALQHRWVPELTATLHEVELALDEEEREDMVRAAWAATAGREGPAMSGFRLLVCVDGSAAALEAARLAIRLAAEHGGEVLAVSVLADGEAARRIDARGRPGRPTGERIAQGLRAVLDRVAALATEQGVAVTTELLEGDPLRTLVRRGRQWEPDMVLDRSHGPVGARLADGRQPRDARRRVRRVAGRRGPGRVSRTSAASDGLAPGRHASARIARASSER